jgi:drug/metabolite transporter (DMT)-like permease
MLVTFLIPVSAVLLGASILGEKLETKHVLGMATIAAGLASIDGRPLALLRRRGRRSSLPADAAAAATRNRSVEPSHE